MAPEMASKKETNEKIDVWSFGSVLFELFTYICPYGGDDNIAMTGLTQKKPVHPGTLPKVLT